MRIAITGATGNIGTALLRTLLADPVQHDLVGIARRPPRTSDRPADPIAGRVRWVAADLAAPDVDGALAQAFRGAEAVVHLAWTIENGHDPARQQLVNVTGSRRVVTAAVAAGVSTLVVASSVGAYSPGPKDRRVDESWPTGGIPTSTYSRHKAAVERILDAAEREHPGLRLVRMRPGLSFQRAAAAEIGDYFLGRLVPRRLIGRLATGRRLPFVPAIRGVALQAVHADDVAAAYALAVRAGPGGPRGAFNLAAEPVLDAAALAGLLGGRPVRVPARLVRAVVALSYRARLQPTEPGWFDMGTAGPLVDSTRARAELGWSPTYDAGAALLELFAGLADVSAGATPVLARRFR